MSITNVLFSWTSFMIRYPTTVFSVFPFLAHTFLKERERSNKQRFPCQQKREMVNNGSFFVRAWSFHSWWTKSRTRRLHLCSGTTTFFIHDTEPRIVTQFFHKVLCKMFCAASCWHTDLCFTSHLISAKPCKFSLQMKRIQPRFSFLP